MEFIFVFTVSSRGGYMAQKQFAVAEPGLMLVNSFRLDREKPLQVA
jgi:hypothetical protein